MGKYVGMVGPKPQFELRGGWLILRPSDGWTQPFFLIQFSDATMNLAEWRELITQESVGDLDDFATAYFDAIRGDQVHDDALKRAMQAKQEADRRKGLTRDLASYSLFIGEALSKVLQSGDALKFSRDGNGDFQYSVRRKGDTIFSAGSIGRTDEGGPFAVWQSADAYPKFELSKPSSIEEIAKNMRQLQELENTHRVYATARVNQKLFRLLDGEGGRADGYYVYLARRNPVVEGFEFTPRAVHAAGRLDVPGRELIVDAAQQLLVPKTMLL